MRARMAGGTQSLAAIALADGLGCSHFLTFDAKARMLAQLVGMQTVLACQSAIRRHGVGGDGREDDGRGGCRF